MRTLGLIGGTGWVSTLEYYRGLNETVNRRLGGHESCRMALYSFNFGDIMRAKEAAPDQAEVRKLVVQAAGRLASTGVEGIMLCANTLHWFAEDVERATPVPLIHIARAAAGRINSAGLTRVGLLGTRPTMEQDFYRRRLEESGIEVLVPDEPERAFIDRAIFEELLQEVFTQETKSRFLEIVEDLRLRGAQGVVLGCTEIPLLLKQSDCPLPLFDTLRIHVEAAVDWALATGP
jgi:aspartate racemase